MDQALRDTVIAECAQHRSQNSKQIDYRACITTGAYFVKFGAPRDLEPELATQGYLYNYAQSVPDAPRIAQIVDYFTHERTMFLILERIQLRESPPDLATRMEEAVKWLAAVPLPTNPTLGPVGGGRIRHKFFKRYKAPLDFPSVERLNLYVQRAYGIVSNMTRENLPPVSILGDRLMFTQSDMDESNFGVDEHGKTVLMDFSEIGLLPKTFVAHTLSPTESIATSLGLSDHPSLRTMAVIAGFLAMVVDPKLGWNTKGSKISTKGMAYDVHALVNA